MNQLSSPMPIPSLRASRTTPSSRRRPSTIQRCASSCCPTMWSAPQSHLMRSYWVSCRVLTKQRQRVPSGIDVHWNVSKWYVGINSRSFFSLNEHTSFCRFLQYSSAFWKSACSKRGPEVIVTFAENKFDTRGKLTDNSLSGQKLRKTAT